MTYRVLLVDDDDIDVMAFKRALKKTGLDFITEVTDSGSKAHELVQRHHFDCIFLDFLLPKTDGLTMLKELKASGVDCPIIIITSQGDENLAVEMMKEGAFDYFTKDELRPEKLRKILSNANAFNQLITERQETQRKLARSSQNLAEAQELAQLGSWEYETQNGNAGYWSDQAYQILGVDPQEVPHPTLSDFIATLHPTDQQKVRKVIDEVVDQHNSQELECRLRSDKGEKWIFLRIRAMSDQNGMTDRLVGSILDITKTKQVEEELRKAKLRAEEAAVAKSDFLSNMSHEIRTPMNAILGLTELLLKGDLSEEAMENLKLIQYSADNLLVIINDILDYSKIEAGKIQFEEIAFNLRYVIKNLVNTLQFKADSKGIGISIEIDKAIPETLMGDPYRFNQIILNLLSNAIKFTKEGEVCISAQCNKLENKIAHIEIGVKDTGIGIPQDKLETIFESFTQASTKTTRTFGGTGLGLSITKRLIEMQDGKLNVKSEYGKGSHFYFTMHFPIGDQVSHMEDNNSTDSSQSLEDIRILVAEDNLVNQMLIKKVLKDWGVITTIAVNGTEVLEEASTGLHDLIFMDLHMPKISGYDATEKIRAMEDPAINQVPIIALTADAMRETRERVLNSGFDDIITKPFKRKKLHMMIHKHLQRSGK